MLIQLNESDRSLVIHASLVTGGSRGHAPLVPVVLALLIPVVLLDTWLSSPCFLGRAPLIFGSYRDRGLPYMVLQGTASSTSGCCKGQAHPPYGAAPR